MKKMVIDTKKKCIKLALAWYEDLLEELNVSHKALIIFNELLLNAYEHGNLEIENKEHIIENDEYNSHLEEKEQLCNKKITIRAKVVGNNFFTAICDEGSGFNVENYLKEKRFSGRGISLSRKLADGIFYNEKGNKVCFYIKHKK
ncbi:MAG: ATP-binding protein [Epsilonproteobacteria bacterium]|nr:ATP-binding protein [Campylobacterota bacterium]